jgi:hypothetical protein
LLLSGVFVIIIYTCPVVATLLYSFVCVWERRTKAIRVSLGEAKPRADTNEFSVEMGVRDPVCNAQNHRVMRGHGSRSSEI